jgi:hypothetical protein
MCELIIAVCKTEAPRHSENNGELFISKWSVKFVRIDFVNITPF